ncbi:signal transduction histidine kinase/CheY-like chemotaxis protein [Aquimarina sp. EL_43]|uniref:ATP-binding protein n=1 Tax=Aquimarina TaxID=290174 RepID=UPI000472D658|nr:MULTISPECIES: transporter substrate-binding domain-containing protein [Aquimarina]MBG6129192.1 signal transduction histidine kinase/CheY-like chemotaxis protein [Aquimarina sp. EL_35]MBG6150257.1 signal transduction histidine kinase/CheY-like chemotaxis protein [Aquimarina sp. EL_32]MBG6167058.1 signal transduction histidine kinase/CheY-like chemotaxis protein [Aquimarina sp. EL_43]
MRNRKTFLLPFLFFLCSILFFSCSKEKIVTNAEADWLKQNDSITIALFPYYPPYQFINNNTTIEGIFIEYFNLIEDKIDHKFKKRYYSNWSQLVKDAKSKKIDMILEAQQTWDRSQYLNFYTEFFNTPFVLVASKDTPDGLTLKDFSTKTITVPLGYSSEEYLRKKHPEIKLKTYLNESIALQMVQTGKHDAYFGPKTVANFLIKSKNFDNLKIIAETKYSYIPSIAVDKDNTVLNKIIQKTINNISDSEKQNIVENWLYTKTKPFYKNPNFLIPLVFFILLGLLIVLGINFYLGYTVKHRTKALRIAKDNAEKDNQLKTAFIYNISHEIRTPMNGIIGFSRLLKESSTTDNQKAKYTKIIVDSSKQLIDSMDNILEISKLQTKQVILTREETDLYEVFDIVFSTFEIIAKKKGISLILNNNLLDNQRYVHIDKSKLIKIITSLVKNAVKYTQRGAVLISVMLQADLLVINVRDSGIGIDPKNQQLIFKSFSQSENQISRKYGGLGLGLTIAKEYTNLMKGELSFSSIPDKGSTFRVELPYRPITISNPLNTISSTLYKDTKTRQHTILIAEDGDVNFLVLKTILLKIENYHFTIHRAKNGKEAVIFCKENNPISLVFMDMKMPEMDGYDATKLIKKLHPELPVIAQTAYANKEDILNVFAAGCDDFIAKPIDPEILKKVIHKHLSIYSF